MSSMLKSFNNVLKGHLDFLVREFPVSEYPQMSDVRVLQTAVEHLQSMNPRMVLKQYMYMLSPLVREIFLRQEEFFTDPDNIKKQHPYFQDSNNVPVVSGYEDYCNQDTLITKFLAIREFWDRIDEHKRDRIWKFFQAGLRIGAMASNDGTLLRYIDYLVNATKGCKTTSDFSRVKTLSYGEYQANIA